MSPRVFLFCGLALIALPAAADDDPVAIVRTCANKVTRDIVGIDKLQQSCPGLWIALNNLGVATRLQSGWDKKIDAHMLNEVLALHERYSGDPKHDAPKIESLHNAIAGLGQEQTSEQQSWWQTALSWLRKMFTPRSSESPEWLRAVLRHLSLPEIVGRLLVYASIAVVVGLAIALVVIELRAAGIFSARGRRNDLDSPPVARGAGDKRRLTLTDIEAAKWNDRPALLLRLLAAKLVELKRLQGEKSLTHRELSRRAQFPMPEDRERFTRLALLAEKLRFGANAAGDSEIEKTVEQTLADNRTLLKALNAEQAG